MRRLQEDAEDDEEVAELLRATSDPAEVEKRIRSRFEERKADVMSSPKGAHCCDGLAALSCLC